MEEEYEIFSQEQKLSSSPVKQMVNVLLGCFFMILSFCILIHIVFYKLIRVDGNPKSEFLNDLMEFFEFNLARFVSTFIFAGLTFYILLMTLKGNIKFGLRILFFMPIHVMKLGRTYINTFLFNVLLIMICTPAIIHFMIELFESYMRLTSGVFIFTVLIRRMKFFRYFYEKKVFFYLFLLWGLLTFVYLMCKP